MSTDRLALEPLGALARRMGMPALQVAITGGVAPGELTAPMTRAIVQEVEAAVGPWSGTARAGSREAHRLQDAISRALRVPGVSQDRAGDGDWFITPRGTLVYRSSFWKRDQTFSLQGSAAAKIAIGATLLGLVEGVRDLPFDVRDNPASREDEDEDERGAAANHAALARLGAPQVGLNADWAVPAYFLGPGSPNRTAGATYLLDTEDGRWILVRRWYVDDDYAGMPEEFRAEADGDNDAIVELARFETAPDAVAFIEAERRGARPNPVPAAAVALLVQAIPFILTALGRMLGHGVAGFNALSREERREKLRAILNSKAFYASLNPITVFAARRAAKSPAAIEAVIDLLEQHGARAVEAGTAAAQAAVVAHGPKANPGVDEATMWRIQPALQKLADGWTKGHPIDSVAAWLPDVGVIPWDAWSTGAQFFGVPDRYARAVWEEFSLLHPDQVRENPRRNRGNPAPFAALAARDGLSHLAAWLREHELELQSALAQTAEIVSGAPEARTASKRRTQAFAALAVLRRAQATAAANHGVLPLLSPEERAALATWSGLGGLFRSCAELRAEEVALLRPDQQEYCRLEAERLLGQARGLSASELPTIPMEVTFAFEGMIAQYFTPEHIAEGMCRRAVECWDATNPVTRPLRVLEPSAGSGRMVQGWRRANLGAAQWTLVEWDKDQADLLQLVYGVSPDYRVFSGPIESYVGEFPPTIADNRVDLVIANPPYADRRVGSRRADKPYEKVLENQNYFVLRSLDYLKPRGVTIQLVPWGILTATKGEDQRVRTEILKRAHFFGAVEIPSDVFPNSFQNVVLLVLGKRPVALPSVLPEDAEIDAGHWLQRPVPAGPEGPHMGYIQESSKNYRGGTLRTGEFDYAKLAEFTSREPPKSYFAEVKATAGEIAAAKTVRNDRLGISVADVVKIGELLGSRCVLVREARIQNADRARGLLAELRPDLTAYVERFGLPRVAKLPSDYRPSASWYALVSAFNEDGTFSELIGSEVAGPVSTYAGDGTPADVVRFLSARKGFATQGEIEGILGHALDTTALLLHPDVFWYPERGDDELCYLRAQEFLSGPCWARMEWARTQRDNGFAYAWRHRPRLSATDTAALAARAGAMVDALMAAIAPKPIQDIDITIRSEWLYPPVPGEADTLDAGILLEWIKAKKEKESYGWRFSLDSIRIIAGRMVPQGEDVLDRMVQDVVAYYNRDEEVDKRGQGGKKQKGRRNTEDLAGRIKADTEKDQQFAAFVRNHATAMEVALRYNQTYRGFVPRKYDESPMEVARFNPEDEKGNRVTVRPYIWASVRRAVERRGGIMALDVGLGKTFALLLAAAVMREQGKARRIMVAVPNSVGPNWISEISRILPDYRVLPLGFTPKLVGGKLRSTSDDVEVITRKLSDFAAGLYDIAICQHSTLARFGVSEERAKELLSGRISSSRAIAEEKIALQAKAQQIHDLNNQIRLLEASARHDEGAAEEVDKARDKLDGLTGADVRELSEKLEKLKREVKGLDRQVLAQAQETATTQKELDTIAAQLLTFDEIEEVERRIRKKQSVAQATIRNEVNDAIALESYIADRVPEPAVHGISFDELGVDLLAVDEAHQFKNLYGAATRYGQKLKYMGALDADKVTIKCWDLLVKCLAVRDRNEGTGVLLLTATPLKNSPLEAYSLLSYCTDEAWSRRGISGPESFIDRFCVGMPEPVLKVNGSFDYQLAVNKFTNLDELRSIFAEWVDVKAAMRRKEYEAMVNAGRNPGANIVPLDLPADVSVEHMIPMTKMVSQHYEEIRKELASEAEGSVGTLCDQAKMGLSETEKMLVDSGQVDLSAMDELEAEQALPRAANPRQNRGKDDDVGGKKESKGGEVLRAMDQMTKLATDPGLMGLIDPDAPIPLKYMAVAETIAKSKAENGDCAHIVFSDYNETHSGLRAAISKVAGIPTARIKLVTGALSVGQRQQVVDGFNGTWDAKTRSYSTEPEFDVVIGNTPTMGEGLNLQQRACSIHHITLPWEPASIQQRNGRGVRQGNRYDLVTIHYYLTERSFDGYKLSLIKGKRAWMVGLLESAAKTTNNPGASMGGPCAILKALAADPEAAAKACQCLEAAGAIREIAKRKSAALQDFAAYIGAYDSSRRAREDDTKRYYRDQAVALRAKLERMGPSLFPYKEWLDRVADVRALVIPATGRVFLEGAWYLIGGEAAQIEKIDIEKATMTVRPMNSWTATSMPASDYRILQSEIAPMDPPSQAERDKAIEAAPLRIYGKESVQAVTPVALTVPAVFKAKIAEALHAGYGVTGVAVPALVPDATGQPTAVVWTPEVYSRGVAIVGEVMMPAGEDIERFLKAIRALPREIRIAKRPRFQRAFEEWFGKVYPAALREEQMSPA